MSWPEIREPERYLIDDSSILPPLGPDARKLVRVIRGPNIQPFPILAPLEPDFQGRVVIKVGDDVSTDAILPAGSHILPLRSNIPAISEFVYSRLDPDFVKRCRAIQNAVVIGGENYGQGSSREHAALAPRYLGVRVAIAKSFARIHRANLANFGVVFLTFRDRPDYEGIATGANVVIPGLRDRIASGETEIAVDIGGRTVVTRLDASPRERQYLLAGSALNLAQKELER